MAQKFAWQQLLYNLSILGLQTNWSVIYKVYNLVHQCNFAHRLRISLFKSKEIMLVLLIQEPLEVFNKFF